MKFFSYYTWDFPKLDNTEKSDIEIATSTQSVRSLIIFSSLIIIQSKIVLYGGGKYSTESRIFFKDYWNGFRYVGKDKNMLPVMNWRTRSTKIGWRPWKRCRYKSTISYVQNRWRAKERKKLSPQNEDRSNNDNYFSWCKRYCKWNNVTKLFYALNSLMV